MQSLIETNRWAWDKLRMIVLARDAHRCQLGLDGCTSVATEVDHRTPRAAGGLDDLHNLRSLCHHCHVRRVLEGTDARRPQRLSYGHRPSGTVTRRY